MDLYFKRTLIVVPSPLLPVTPRRAVQIKQTIKTYYDIPPNTINGASISEIIPSFALEFREANRKESDAGRPVGTKK